MVIVRTALARDRAWRQSLGASARVHACERSWATVFDGVYRAYAEAVALANPNAAIADGWSESCNLPVGEL